VEVLKETYEKGRPEGEEAGKWRRKLDSREEKLKYLQNGERYFMVKMDTAAKKGKNQLSEEIFNAVEIPKTHYSGKIKEINLGKGDKAITVGGENSFPFYLLRDNAAQTQNSDGSARLSAEEWPKHRLNLFTM